MMQRIRQWLIASMVAFVRGYQVILRPLFAGSCRFVPGCSEYFIEAVRTHGPVRGGWLGFKRIMRCRPGGGWGYDPVPRCNETASNEAGGQDVQAAAIHRKDRQ